MVTAESFAQSYVLELQRCLKEISVDGMAAVAERILDAYRRDRLVMILGNGGSAATASHLAADLSKTILGRDISPTARRFRVMALTDNVALLTAWGNDVGYETVFAEQLRAWMHPEDLLIVISASGNSPNVCAAVQMARVLGAFTIGFLGFGGGLVGQMVDLSLVVPSRDYGQVEDLHLMLGHLVTGYLRDIVAAEEPLVAPAHRVSLTNTPSQVTVDLGMPRLP